MGHVSLYIPDAFGFDSDSDTNYGDFDSDFCCSNIIFVELAP